MNDSALDKEQGDYIQFSPKNDFRKIKMDLILPIIFVITQTDGSCYRVIDSSILQEVFSFVLKCSVCNANKHQELIRQY